VAQANQSGDLATSICCTTWTTNGQLNSN